MNVKELGTQEIINESTRRKAGIKRNITQIGDTFTFELKKNLIPFIIMMGVSALMFILFLILQWVQEIQDVPLPTNSVDYFGSFFQFIFGFLVILTASGFAGSIIAEDFQKQTGNILFPKISKSKLFVGRIMARFLMNAICIIFYYILVSSITYIKFGEVPSALLSSLAFALFYTFSLFSMVTFMSSILKSTSASIIASIFIYLLVFTMITQILSVIASVIEPWFLLPYYEKIITAILNMPAERYGPNPNAIGPPGFSGSSIWLTPDVPTALFGMLIYSMIFLTLAYFRYRRRQSKSES